MHDSHFTISAEFKQGLARFLKKSLDAVTIIFAFISMMTFVMLLSKKVDEGTLMWWILFASIITTNILHQFTSLIERKEDDDLTPPS